MRRGAFTVRRPNWRRLLGSLATFAFMVAFVVAAGFVSDLDAFVVVFLAFAAYATLGEAWRSSLRLRIDADGVLVREPAPGIAGRAVSVPWSSIRELVLTTGYVPGSVEPVPTRLGVRLVHGAPLPSGAHAVIHDPDAPDDAAPAISLPLSRLGIDRRALEAAVAEHGGGRRLVEQRGAAAAFP